MANLIINPSFESGTSPWIHYTNGTGIFTVVDGGVDGSKAAEVAVITTGTNIQLSQSDLSLKPNKMYVISFAAKSNTSRDIVVELMQNTPPWTNYGLMYLFDLQTSWKTFQFEFYTRGFSVPITDAKLTFNFSRYCNNGDIYYIDAVRFEEKSICIPNWVCESQQSGYEIDGCGNRRLNSNCPKCTPTWVCETPLNGYEKDGCGNRRPNSKCNPCSSTWVCETPLNGYEKDGCGNRLPNYLKCSPGISNWVCEIPLNGYEKDQYGFRRLNPVCNPMAIPFKVVGYQGVYRNNPPNETQLQCLTHLIYFALKPQIEGTVKMMWNYGTDNMDAWIAKAHARNIKVLIAIATVTTVECSLFAFVAADKGLRAKFIANLDAFVTQHNLDGVSMEWEFSSGDPKYFITLMSELDQLFHNKGKLVALLALGHDASGSRDLIYNNVDFVNVEAYRLMDETVKDLDYWQIEHNLPQYKTMLGIHLSLDKTNPWYQYGNLTTAQAIEEMKKKTILASNRAGGVMLWEMGMDMDNKDNLVQTIYNAIPHPECPELQNTFKITKI